MKANELRLGNLIQGNLKSGKGRTVQFSVVLHILEHIQNNDGNVIYEPIQLTEEWLIKFGFFKFNNAWVLKEPASNSIEFNFSIWEDLTYNTGELNPPLEYVHQMQNLYFALTGEELILK